MTNTKPTLLARLRNLSSDERGANGLEYALIAGLIAVTVIAGFKTFGTNLNDKVNGQANKISEIPQ